MLRPIYVSLVLLILSFSSFAAQKEPQKMLYHARDFSHLLNIKGLSENALKIHFKLYQGYVANTNTLMAFLQEQKTAQSQKSPQFQEITRRLGWEYNGMKLHELYFSNLTPESPLLDPDSALVHAIAANYGSYEAWKEDFISTGLLRGIGWVILYRESDSERLINVWVGEHDKGPFVEGHILLVMDVWEHAYMLDYGIDRAQYIKVFFDNIDWAEVMRRYAQTKPLILSVKDE